MSDDREETIRRYFPLVRTIARRLNRLVPGTDLDDLIGDGCVGLIRAVDSFDATRGTTLRHYASRVIAGSMLNGMRRMDPVSERARREVREADRQRYAIAAETGRIPTQIEMESLRPRLRSASANALRFTPLSLDVKLPIGQRLRIDWSADPAAVVVRRRDRQALQQALQGLPPRSKCLLALHYAQGWSLRHIARHFNISAQRASQVHLAAILKLRKVMSVAR
jgi:RNA polymerase sigma factor (sigma-70 family)